MMAEEYLVLGEMESVTGWTVLGTSTDNLVAAASPHAWGVNCVEFDKKSGATVYAGAYRTVAFDLRLWNPEDRICWLANPDTADNNMVASIVRLGTSSSHYSEWRFAVGSMTASRFNLCSAKLGDVYVTGNGWNPAVVTYMAVGFLFTNITDALDPLHIDQVYLRSSVFTQT